MQGKESKGIEEAGAGDIVALAKLKDTGTGDTLSDPANPVRFAQFSFRQQLSLSPSPPNPGRRGKGEQRAQAAGRRRSAMGSVSMRRPRNAYLRHQPVHEVILDKLQEALWLSRTQPTSALPGTSQEGQLGRHKKTDRRPGPVGDCWIERTQAGASYS